jgi:hypothetical protein
MPKMGQNETRIADTKISVLREQQIHPFVSIPSDLGMTDYRPWAEEVIHNWCERSCRSQHRRAP